MMIAIIMLGMLGLVSVMTTTKESRAESRTRLARWNPLFIAILLLELAVIFLIPWPPYQP